MAAENNNPPVQNSSPPKGQEDVVEQEELPEEELQDKNEQFLAVMAKAMPWVISLLFHVGIFLIMIFVVFLVMAPENTDEIIIPDAVMSDNPGGRMTEAKTMSKTQSKTVTKSRVRKETVSIDAGKTTKPLDIYGVGGGGAAGGATAMGMATGGGGAKSSFFGSGGNAFNVVFVVDRSGSMLDTFGPVRAEMLRTISRLRETQMFHVILFAEGRPLEPDHKRLVPASRRNKKAASRFLSDITAEGQTNPIPALQRAFKVLKGARKKGKLIYLLTDGVFPDNEAILKTIAHENKDGTVHINTFLYGTAPPEAVSVMTKIADNNGGRYKFIEHED
jgi:hypothetical protein